MDSASAATDTSHTGSVSWGRVGLFFSIAFGMVSLLGVVLWRLDADWSGATAPSVVFQLTLAFLYMPMPLVAGLVVERVAGRRALIRETWRDFKAGWLRVIGVSVAVALALYVVNLALTAVAGNLFGVEGVGTLVSTQEGVAEAIRMIAPAASAEDFTSMPPVGLLYLLGAVAGLSAGFTVNGLFAFGEEYGWRGVLMDELAPLGPVRANLITGIMWGVWHAPVILMGFNYGQHRWLGMVMMCVWVIPLSFALWRAREFSGSVVAPAVIHGAINGSAGFFLFLMLGRNPLVAAPVGLVGALSAAIVAGALWRLTSGRLRSEAAPLRQPG